MSLFTKKTPTEKSELFAALDIGANKICCAIAKVNNRTSSGGNPGDINSQLRIVGVGYQVSRGIKAGKIIDLEALEDSILNAVHSAEQTAKQNINSVYVNLPAGATSSHNIRAEIYLSNNAVDETHLRRLLSVNRDTSINADRQVIHVLPLSYCLDSIEGIRDPRGMIGEKLSVNLHVVSAPIGLIRNLTSCIGRCHLDVAGYVVPPYASGLAILVEDELELGVTIVDLGGGNTTIASFYEGNLVHIDSIPLGGSSITNDIARGLATPLAQAERLKTLYGTLIPSSSDDRESILVTQMGETDKTQAYQIPKGTLIHIIRSRVEEILELVGESMRRSPADPVVYQRIVLTGGTNQLQGIREMASHILGKQVRLGQPTGLIGMGDIVTSPTFSTCAGLLQYGLQDYSGNQIIRINAGKSQVWQRFNMWIKENF